MPQHTITLRQATVQDLPLIQNLAGKTWNSTYGQILSPKQLDYMFDWMYSLPSLENQMMEKGHAFFLAYEEGCPQGFVSIEKQAENLFHLQKLYIIPEGQGKGIGKILIKKAFDYAKEHSNGEECAVELNVNRHNKALEFYQKMGMKIHSQGDFDIGNGYYMNDYILRISLKKNKLNQD
jgi:diamine N-acetyltransferase